MSLYEVIKSNNLILKYDTKLSSRIIFIIIYKVILKIYLYIR